LLGTLVEQGHTFTARNAAGRKMAKFSTLREAMAALADAGRAPPEHSSSERGAHKGAPSSLARNASPSS
jgi:hypothetical protein